MSCQSCKKKKQSSPVTIGSVNHATNKIENVVKIFIVVWSMFGIYGFFSLIKLFI
jgi:hypothetical protein